MQRDVIVSILLVIHKLWRLCHWSDTVPGFSFMPVWVAALTVHVHVKIHNVSKFLKCVTTVFRAKVIMCLCSLSWSSEINLTTLNNSRQHVLYEMDLNGCKIMIHLGGILLKSSSNTTQRYSSTVVKSSLWLHLPSILDLHFIIPKLYFDTNETLDYFLPPSILHHDYAYCIIYYTLDDLPIFG